MQIKRQALLLMKRLSLLPAATAILLIRGYQLMGSPWIGNQCRFTPTCSQYAIEAYKNFGFFKGTWLSLQRIIRCNPWHESGVDEVSKK